MKNCSFMLLVLECLFIGIRTEIQITSENVIRNPKAKTMACRHQLLQKHRQQEQGLVLLCVL